uniref:Potassium channel toxin alpha-KTx 26.2 n=1 Tax=Lychas mucronatus TaxID=172552 RepID=KA262_LYCMC|nr:RecName: Full=Potassium channel toxin alpha-KTx 26.2; AltName: Full=Neurotoxin KTx13; Flags: Precursor [Lychas mucronatus]ABY26668.1 neurotoxin KTx13 [Lychas mucronatus]
MKTIFVVILVLFVLSAMLASSPDTTAEAAGCRGNCVTICRDKGKVGGKCYNGKCFCFN